MKLNLLVDFQMLFFFNVTRNTRFLPVNLFIITDDYLFSSTVYSVLEGSK